MLHIGDNLRDFERQLSDALQEQLPFAAAQALNDTGSDVAEAIRAEMGDSFDRPTPFTQRGPAILRRASKRLLTVVPGVRRIQSGYLRLQAEGGTRSPTGQALLVPVGARLNRYGNMPRNYVRTLISSGRGFVASRNDPRTRHLPPGIYRRRTSRGVAGAPELLVAFEDSARYTARFDHDGVARRTALRVFERHLSRRLQAAWATRR